MDCDHELDFIPDLDNGTQRLKKNPPDPLEDMRRKNALFLSQLEFFALEALFTGDWDGLIDFINSSRGVKNPPRLQRVSLQEFLGNYSCLTQTTIIAEVDAADEMNTPNQPSMSALYKAISAIAEYLEDEFPPKLFAFMDGGTTLQVMSEALNQASSDSEWQRLVIQYKNVGGYLYCPDDNEWEAASDDAAGISEPTRSA